jgi:hypothetical protein
MRLCIIGDIHGRKPLLERIVNAHPGYHYVLLGDIIHHKRFFRRSVRMSPLRVIDYVMALGDRASIVMGNNEKYVLERFCTPISEVRKSEARYTLNSIRSLEPKRRIEVIKFLVNLPTSLEIENYRFGHAYYQDPNPNLYGPGYRWFTPEYAHQHPLDPEYEYFFGHYGKPYFRKNIRIIDCTELDAAGVWLSDTSEFKVFT